MHVPSHGGSLAGGGGACPNPASPRQPGRARRGLARCPTRLKADGRADIGEAVAGGVAAVLAPEGTTWPAGAVRARCSPTPSRAAAWPSASRSWPAPSSTRWPPSPGPTARPAPPSSPASSAAHGWPAAAVRHRLIAPGSAGPRLNTPDPVALAAAALARAGIEHAAMEASRRARPVPARRRAPRRCRLHQPHPRPSDYHGGMAEHRAAKLRLFAALLPAGAAAVASTALEAEIGGAGARHRRKPRPAPVHCRRGRRRDPPAARDPRPDGQVLAIEADGDAELHPPARRRRRPTTLVAAALARATGRPRARPSGPV